jgi:signal peptidase I
MARAFRGAGAALKDLFAEGSENIIQLAKFGSLYYCILHYGIDVTTCIGPSMLPTFNTVGDVVLLERLSAARHCLDRGDVVVAKSLSQPNQTVCKRIRALEGDVVDVPVGFLGYHARRVVVPPGHGLQRASVHFPLTPP